MVILPSKGHLGDIYKCFEYLLIPKISISGCYFWSQRLFSLYLSHLLFPEPAVTVSAGLAQFSVHLIFEPTGK